MPGRCLLRAGIEGGRRPRGSGDPELRDRTYLVARDGHGVAAPHIISGTSPSCGHGSIGSGGVANDDWRSTRNRERLGDRGPFGEAADAPLERRSSRPFLGLDRRAVNERHLGHAAGRNEREFDVLEILGMPDQASHKRRLLAHRNARGVVAASDVVGIAVGIRRFVYYARRRTAAGGTEGPALSQAQTSTLARTARRQIEDVRMARRLVAHEFASPISRITGDEITGHI